MANVKEFVAAKIEGKKVVVFSKSYCPYCKKVKTVLDVYLKEKVINPDEYEVIELDSNPQVKEIQRELEQLTGVSSVPRVFINGICIGGGDETVALHDNGNLRKLLQN